MEKEPVRKNIRLPRPSYRKGDAFFITIGTFMKYPWFSKYPDLANDAVDQLRKLVSERGSRLYAWCVMPNHIHLLLQDEDIVSFIRLFKGPMTPKARRKEKSRRLWQRSFYDHGIRREVSLERIAEYIWENPVRRGIVNDPLEFDLSGSEVWPDWKAFFGRG